MNNIWVKFIYFLDNKKSFHSSNLDKVIAWYKNKQGKSGTIYLGDRTGPVINKKYIIYTTVTIHMNLSFLNKKIGPKKSDSNTNNEEKDAIKIMSR